MTTTPQRANAPDLAPAGTPVSVEAFFQLSGAALKVRVRIVNRGASDVYVFNRLWNLDDQGHHVPDPEKAYRFVRGEHLRLLWGAPPMPRSKTPFYRKIPDATRLAAGATVEEEFALSVPVAEHGGYFSRRDSSVETPVKTRTAEMLVQYTVASERIKVRPPRGDSKVVEFETPGAWDDSKTVSSGRHPLEVPALRRTDEFERLTLPGETVEPLRK